MLSFAAALYAGDFKVIANSNVAASELSRDDLRSIFLNTKTSLAGTHVIPVIQKSAPLYQAFLKACLGKTDAALNAYYRSLIFTGQGAMPKVFVSDQQIIEYVAKTKGAIGYIRPDQPAPGVKTLRVK